MKNWFKLLAAAAIGGAATATTQTMTSTAGADLKTTGSTALAGAIVSALLYAANSPWAPPAPTNPQK